MSNPINWYQSQRSTVDLWFGPVYPTLPAPWQSVTDDSSGMVFYWNPETNVSQYEHPNPPPPPPPPPPPYPPDHYQFPFEYTTTFPSSALTYRPPDYLASYMPELPVAPLYTSPICLPHPAPPSVVFSTSIDVPQIPHSYATNPNFQDPQIYSPSSYEQNSWVFDFENRLQFNDPHQVSPYEIDLGPDSHVHTAHTAGNVFSMVRGARHTSPKMPLKSIRAKHKIAVCSHVRMKRKALFMSFCHRRQQNPVLPSFSAAPSLPLVPLPQAQEQTSPTNREQHLLNTNPSASPEWLLESFAHTSLNPNPQMELGHVLVVGESRCHESLAGTVFLLPGAEVDAEGELVDALPLHADVVDSDLGVGHTAPEAGFRVGFVLDICHSDVTADQGQGYQQFQFDVLTLVGDQLGATLCYSQRNAVQLFDEMPKGKLMIQSSIIMEVPSTHVSKVPILWHSPLKNAQLDLEFMTQPVNFEMIVFNFYGVRRNIFAPDVFDKMKKAEIGTKFMLDFLLDPHHWTAIINSVPKFWLVEIGDGCTMDVFLYALESVGSVNKMVYPELSLHLPAWWFLTISFQTRNVQRDIEPILVSQTTLLTDIFCMGESLFCG